MVESRRVYRSISQLLILSVLIFVASCGSASEQLSSITPISPRVLPYFLEDVYPDQGSIVSTDDYAGKICVQMDACDLILEGDIWDFDEVITRTTILVDDQPTGEYSEAYEILVGCATTDEQGSILSQAGGPYKWCVSAAPIATGIHRVDTSFERSNGEVVSFAWTFELVSGSVPTPTSLPESQEVDRVGYFPEYVEAVFPLPGEILFVSPDDESRLDLLEERGMPSVRLSSPDLQPVCIALVYSELIELGALPRWEGFRERVYLSVDGGSPGEWLYPMSGVAYPGRVVAQCIEVALTPGEHIATVYVNPYDNDLTVYSWAFTIADE